MLFCGACKEAVVETFPRIIEYPIPFYKIDSDKNPRQFYWGIETSRFRYIENENGAWILNDKNLDAHINMVGADEYIFIQSDLAQQLRVLRTSRYSNYFPVRFFTEELYRNLLHHRSSNCHKASQNEKKNIER